MPYTYKKVKLSPPYGMEAHRFVLVWGTNIVYIEKSKAIPVTSRGGL
jgi:hypothetical protein